MGRFRRHPAAGAVRAPGHHRVSRGQAAEAGPLPRPAHPEPLRGRDGEVHRLRAVRRCLPRPVHLRPGGRQPPRRPVSPGERYGFVYEINYLRCIHCDLCVEACPTEAITETKLFEFSFTKRSDAIYTKRELLVDDDGRARQMPWEHWVGDEDERASAWVRATAPSGEDAYEGRVAWSPELGFGLRPPEGAEAGAGAGQHPAGASNPAPMERIGRRGKAHRGAAD